MGTMNGNQKNGPKKNGKPGFFTYTDGSTPQGPTTPACAPSATRPPGTTPPREQLIHVPAAGVGVSVSSRNRVGLAFSTRASPARPGTAPVIMRPAAGPSVGSGGCRAIITPLMSAMLPPADVERIAPPSSSSPEKIRLGAF